MRGVWGAIPYLLLCGCQGTPSVTTEVAGADESETPSASSESSDSTDTGQVGECQFDDPALTLVERGEVPAPQGWNGETIPPGLEAHPVFGVSPTDAAGAFQFNPAEYTLNVDNDFDEKPDVTIQSDDAPSWATGNFLLEEAIVWQSCADVHIAAGYKGGDDVL